MELEALRSGNDTGNTLWINQENMYIVDEAQIQNIYNKVNGLQANSFEGMTIIDPALDVGDKIIIDGKPVIYQGSMDFQGRFIANIKSKIALKQKQETTVKQVSQKVINRRVESNINQIEGKITQLVEENTETSNKLTKHEQTIDNITDTLSSVETKVETVESTANTATSLANTAQSTANTANTTANSAKTKADSNATKIQTTTTKLTELEKTVDGITQSVSNVEEKVETVESKADNAQSTANTAKATADNINNNLTKNYYTKTETNSQIQQKADSITTSVNKKITEIQVDADNLLLNTALKKDASNFSLASGVTRVTDKLTPNNNYCFKYNISGLTADAYRSANPTNVNLNAGEIVTASANVYIPSGVTNSTIRIEIQYFKADGTRITTSTSVVDLTKTNIWQRVSVTGTAPANTVKANARVWIQRNGQCWVGDLKLGRGNTVTSWCPSSKDYLTETEARSLITQTADNINLEVSKKVGNDEIISKINQSAEKIRN